MITLIEGGFFAGGRELVRERIKALTEKGKRSMLIVPEQQTVLAEREMTDLLPDSAPLFFEVTNFTRLTDTVFRLLGGLAGESANEAKRSLIMWKALTELSPLFESRGGSSEVSAGSICRMLGAVKQMQSYAITPASLADAADLLSSATSKDARLVSKIRDLSMTMTLYKKLLTERFTDTDDALLNAAEKLSAAPYGVLADTEVFIDGFTSFTEPQYKMIASLVKKCELTVSLTLPKASPEAYEFTEIRSTHKRIVKLAAQSGAELKRERIDGRRTSAPLMITEIASLLWKSTAKVDTGAYDNSNSLRIFEAENPYEECDFAAADIKRRVMDGADYSDFGIIARNLDDYHGILDLSFKKAGIPLFTSKRTDISSYEVIKLIYSAFGAVSSGFSRADVIAYSKCSLSGVPRGLADEFELYTEKWQINGRRFTDGITWNMNPRGYSEYRRESDEERLLSVDRARNMIITPLTELDYDLSEARTVKDYAICLIDFLTKLDIEENLKKKSEEEKLLFGGGYGFETDRLWKIICDALDSLCEVLGDTAVSKETFLSLLKITFTGTDVGRIPAFIEEVSAGNADVARMYGKKHIYIIGANAGVFPPAVDDDSYFTDKDKCALESAGLPISADTDVRSAKELYYFTRSISYASESVTILYPAKDASFKALAPSDAVIRIKELTDGRISPTKLSSLMPAERIYTPEYATEHLKIGTPEYGAIREACKEVGFDDKLKVSDLPIKNTDLKLSRESLDRLYRSRITMTQSKLDSYAKCPMSYFCTYNLSLKPEDRAEFDSRNIGNFLHSVLENFFKLLKEDGVKVTSLNEKEKLSLIERVASDYVKKCFEGIPEASARLKDTVSKLSRAAKPIVDGLCEEFSDCRFEPVFFELEIGTQEKGNPSPIIFNTGDGKEISIKGKIDRVDTYTSGEDVYVRVIDYKSGRKIFSPKDLERGQNLQMFLYLKSVVETDDDAFRQRIGVGKNGRMIPAGVLYVKTSIDDAKISRSSSAEALAAIKENQARLGMLLDNDESIGAMNPRYIPIKFKKDGTPDARSESKLYTLSGWDRINEVIESSVTELCEKMLSGSIDASPMKNRSGKSESCTYCEYKPICRNAK